MVCITIQRSDTKKHRCDLEKGTRERDTMQSNFSLVTSYSLPPFVSLCSILRQASVLSLTNVDRCVCGANCSKFKKGNTAIPSPFGIATRSYMSTSARDLCHPVPCTDAPRCPWTHEVYNLGQSKCPTKASRHLEFIELHRCWKCCNGSVRATPDKI